MATASRPPTRRPPRPAPTPARHPRSKAFGAPLALSLVALAPAEAHAQPPEASTNGTSTRVLEVRLGLAATVTKALSEPRIRRLLEIELGDDGVLAPGTAGPLGDHVAYVWLDTPTATQLGVEVRVADRPVVRREIPIAGVGPDVAARLVAIAAAELVRQKPRAERPTTQAPPAPAEVELAARARPAVSIEAGGTFAGLPGFGGAVGGPGIGLSFRALGASEGLFARWLQGSGHPGALRWLEVGASLEYRHWLGPSFRLAGGGLASLASLRLADVASLEGVAGDRDTWSARAGATLGLEARVARSLWLGLALEPAVVLRPVRYADANGPATAQGAWLGLALALHLDRPLTSPSDPHR